MDDGRKGVAIVWRILPIDAADLGVTGTPIEYRHESFAA